MGQTVYVLTTLEGENEQKKYREWRPVGVTTALDTADKWVSSGNNNDWIPFELDDVSGMEAGGGVTPFKPGKPTPDQEKLLEYVRRLEASNTKLLKIVDQLQKKKRSSALLNPKE
jgi:hypothetical protein